MRGVTHIFKNGLLPVTFQLTRLMRGVTLRPLYYVSDSDISTHTPHARRDLYNYNGFAGNSHFNSHASCEA